MITIKKGKVHGYAYIMIGEKLCIDTPRGVYTMTLNPGEKFAPGWKRSFYKNYLKPMEERLNIL